MFNGTAWDDDRTRTARRLHHERRPGDGPPYRENVVVRNLAPGRGACGLRRENPNGVWSCGSRTTRRPTAATLSSCSLAGDHAARGAAKTTASVTTPRTSPWGPRHRLVVHRGFRTHGKIGKARVTTLLTPITAAAISTSLALAGRHRGHVEDGQLLGLTICSTDGVDDDADPGWPGPPTPRTGPGGGSSVRGQQTGAHAGPGRGAGRVQGRGSERHRTLTISDDASGDAGC